MSGAYWNPDARGWRTDRLTGVIGFHESLPGYAPTRLVEAPELAAELGVGRVFVKEESSRLGLPAFKILGAAYAISRALSSRFGSPDRALPLDELRTAVADAPGRPLRLVAATDGNHGRAVAHTARLLGLPAQIWFPDTLSAEAKQSIADEGAETVELAIPYDDVVDAATKAAQDAGAEALLIQDTAWPGYEEVPQWIVDGYSTLFEEADAQLAELGVTDLDLVAVPVGVGSLAQAAVRHYRSGAGDGDRGVGAPIVLGVEAAAAPPIIASLRAGEPVSVPTSFTVMSGLNCGTVSGNAWPILRAGLDAAVTVDDDAAIRAVHDLEALDVDSGPCGAAALAGVRALLADDRARAALGPDATVLLLSTEGRLANPLPAGR